jgi:hypothetical protein
MVLKRFIETKVPRGTPDAVMAQTGTGKKEVFLDYTAFYPRKLSSSYSPPWDPEVSQFLIASLTDNFSRLTLYLTGTCLCRSTLQLVRPTRLRSLCSSTIATYTPSDHGLPVANFGNPTLLTSDVSDKSIQLCTCNLSLDFSAPLYSHRTM